MSDFLRKFNALIAQGYTASQAGAKMGRHSGVARAAKKVRMNKFMDKLEGNLKSRKGRQFLMETSPGTDTNVLAKMRKHSNMNKLAYYQGYMSKLSEEVAPTRNIPQIPGQIPGPAASTPKIERPSMDVSTDVGIAPMPKMDLSLPTTPVKTPLVDMPEAFKNKKLMQTKPTNTFYGAGRERPVKGLQVASTPKPKTKIPSWLT